MWTCFYVDLFLCGPVSMWTRSQWLCVAVYFACVPGCRRTWSTHTPPPSWPTQATQCSEATSPLLSKVSPSHIPSITLVAGSHGNKVCLCVTEVGLGQLKKSVYKCQVMGGRGCGKSSFVRGLVGKGLAPVPEELQVEEAMSVKSLTLPDVPGPVYLLVGVACVLC